MQQTKWIKGSLSFANGNCVQIAELPDGQIGIMDRLNVTSRFAAGAAAQRRGLMVQSDIRTVRMHGLATHR
jgi:hypothetical protein